MNLDNFKKIQRVEAPPFLFTRILQKIERKQDMIMPRKFALAANFLFAAVLILNAIVLMNYIASSNTTESYAEYIHLLSSNTLY
jgi:hypothetical protein